MLFRSGLRKNEIGYLPQQTVVQKDFPASVREIILSGCQGRCGSRPFYNKEEKKLAADAMEKMQITPLAKRCYRTLSGGQQQRVLLSRALCATRKMLLLDEPVSGLDPKVTAEMYALSQKLNYEDGITVVMISHDLNAALQYASHILHIGDRVFFGTKAKLTPGVIVILLPWQLVSLKEASTDFGMTFFCVSQDMFTDRKSVV